MLTSREFKWSADMGGEWLCIKLPNSQIMETLNRLSSGKTYRIDIKEHRKKRSLDANAYAWTLIGQLSAKLRIPPDEIYRSFIPDVGGNCEIVPVRSESCDAFCEMWCSGHIGRIAEDLGPCRNTPGYRNLRLYIGSSDYDTAQMARLIDLILFACREQGIDTRDPADIESLLNSWGDPNAGRMEGH